MPIQIANPTVVAKIERLAAATGFARPPPWKGRSMGCSANRRMHRMTTSSRALAILAQLDRIQDVRRALDRPLAG